LAWGLANRIVSMDEIQGQALDIAHDIAAKQPGSIRHTRQLLRPADLADRLEAERRHFVGQIKTTETQESMIAFLEKMAL
jgi:enoyl-CoA hydratase/carnithine racemase